jgi:hypothetical protein
MAVRVAQREGLWLVYEGSVLVYSGPSRRVEDWLDRAENTGRLSPAPPDIEAASPARGKDLVPRARPRHEPRVLACR